MGLGKTIQTIALLLSGVYQPAEPQAQGGRGGGGGGTARKPRKQQQEQAAAAAAAAAPARGAPTLVICPTSAMVQWADEIKAFAVSRPFPSWNRSILTEIYLCHACSCQETLKTETAGQGSSLDTIVYYGADRKCAAGWLAGWLTDAPCACSPPFIAPR
jgi:SNF2 family DNA or RNA helicase